MSQIVPFNKKTYIEGEDLRDKLGIRGAAAMELAALSLPLSPGFILPSYVLKDIDEENIQHSSAEGIASIEEHTQKRFNAGPYPLTLKVVVSPSIHIDSVESLHNIGLNNETTAIFAEHCGEDFAYGEYLHLIEEIGVRCLGCEEKVWKDAQKQIEGKSTKEKCEYYLSRVFTNFPQDPLDQLTLVIKKIRDSYFSDPMNGDIAAAILIQMMTYGNLGENSYNGSYYTRHIVSGVKELSGYFGRNAFWTTKESGNNILDIDSKYLTEFKRIASILEKKFLELREVKFTIEEGNIWLVEQKAVEYKSTRAELRTLLDLHKEEVINDKYLVKKFPPGQLNDLLHPIVDTSSIQGIEKIVGGIAGSPGAAQGRVFFSTKKLMNAYSDARVSGEDTKLILAMKATYAGDVQAIEIGQGVISTEGGYASHAPVVARSLGKAAIVYPDAQINEDHMIIQGKRVNEGDYISMEVPTYTDPSVYLGKVDLVYPDVEENGLQEFMEHVKKHIGTFRVRTNADTAHDSKLARSMGATGIGLCRTEHMFFQNERIMIFREMIVANTQEERLESLNKLKAFQKEDFKGLFEVMDGFGVTVRLLDAPLHEFIPSNKEGIQQTLEHFQKIGSELTQEEILRRFDRLHEVNPMLGHRGCRVAISYPEIYEMQVAAVLEAAQEVVTQKGCTVYPEIMIPIVMTDEELKFIRNGRDIEGTRVQGIRGVVDATLDKYGLKKFPFDYKVGTMIELPSAALSAGHLAKQAEFFSFGTNDLTQTTHGLSRDDINSFLPSYTQYDILKDNPFEVLTSPVRELLSIATQTGRLTRPDLKIGLCGEHGAVPQNIKFCMDIGMDYVSCSPYGVPLAILAVAQHNLANEG